MVVSPFPYSLFPLHFVLLSITWFLTSVSAREIRIDDSDTTFFTFTGSWNEIGPTTPCTGCLAQPDANSIYNQTWHDGGVSGNAGGVIRFNGSAISIYGIETTLQANVRFKLDDNSDVLDTRLPTGYSYDVLFFRANNLATNVVHRLSWTLENSSIGGAFLIDYAVIKVEDPTSTISSTPTPTPTNSNTSSSSETASSSSNGIKTGTLVGAIVGAVGGLALIGVLAFCFIRRRRQNRYDSSHPQDLTQSYPTYGAVPQPFEYRDSTVGSNSHPQELTQPYPTYGTVPQTLEHHDSTTGSIWHPQELTQSYPTYGTVPQTFEHRDSSAGSTAPFTQATSEQLSSQPYNRRDAPPRSDLSYYDSESASVMHPPPPSTTVSASNSLETRVRELEQRLAKVHPDTSSPPPYADTAL